MISRYGNTPAYAGKGTPTTRDARRPREHPRLRGEGIAGVGENLDQPGTPPPTRGRVPRNGHPVALLGNTPAYAGKGEVCGGGFGQRWEHPRLRGEGTPPTASATTSVGTPPPTRGRDQCRPEIRLVDGNTPAYAGKGHCPGMPLLHLREHPRLRGEGRSMSNSQPLMRGTPPPTRGRVCHVNREARRIGNTPAYAGKGGRERRQPG